MEGCDGTENGFSRFPLGSKETGDLTLADQAIEHFGISTNLLEFHPIPSRCGSPSEADLHAASSEGAEALKATDSFDDDEEIDVASPTIAPQTSATGRPNGLFWTPRNSSYHPFIVTRSQLIVTDETRPFNLTSINEGYKRLKTSHVSSPFCPILLGIMRPLLTPVLMGCNFLILLHSALTHWYRPISVRDKTGVILHTRRTDTGTCG